MWLTLIAGNWQMILKAVAAFCLAGVIWWFGWHIPAVAKEQKAQIETLQVQVKNVQDATKLLTQIEVDHENISKESYSNISTIVHKPVPHVLVTGGVPLQTLPQTRPAH